MTKEMIVSATDRETAVAILEDDQVVEFFMERERQQGVVGNVYKGRVSKVLPGMQSSFIDLGLERDGVPLRLGRHHARRGARGRPRRALDSSRRFAAGRADDVAGRDGDDAAELADPVAAGLSNAVAAGLVRQSDGPDDGAGDDEGARAPTARCLRPRPPGRAAIAASGRNAPRSPTSRTCSRKGRTCSCRWSRSRSAPRAPASPRTSRFRAGSWCSCRRSITSASRARSSRARSARACAASCASSARRTPSTAA